MYQLNSATVNYRIVECFFALDTGLRCLFGTDLLKYFNANVDYDDSVLKLYERRTKPGLANGEDKPIQIYSIENG